MTSGRVCVLGSFMADLIVHAARRPGPGETLLGDRFTESLGGKGFNQAVAARRAGAEVSMLGAVGSDARGDAFLAHLDREGIERGGVVRSPTDGTGVGLPVVEPAGQNSIIVVPRANGAFRTVDVRRARERIQQAGVLCVQLELDAAVSIEAARIARDAGRLVLVNPAPATARAGNLLALATHLVPNEVEAAELSGRETADPEACGRALRRAYPTLQVVVTCGARGALHVDDGDAVRWYPAPAVVAIDTVGAGDAFCGYLAAGLAAGHDLPAAITDAVEAASVSVTRTGAAESVPARHQGRSVTEIGTNGDGGSR